MNNRSFPSHDIPVLSLRNTLLFPDQTIPIVVGRTRSVSSVESAFKKDKWLVILGQKSDVGDRGSVASDFYRTGVLARIENYIPRDNGSSHQLVITGVRRFQVTDLRDRDGHWVADGSPLDDILDIETETVETLMKNMKDLAKQIFAYLPPAVSQLAGVVDGISDPVSLSHMVAQHVEAKISRKQELLEMVSLKARFLALLDMLVKVRDELKLQHEVQQKVTNKIGKQQRDALVREQIRTLQDELGEGRNDLSKEYLEKITAAGMPEDVQKMALEQVSRLESLNSASPELNIIRSYLDLIVALPWSHASDEEIDLIAARKVLDEDHYGVEKIKRRIIQHLAVMKLKKEKKGSMLLFVGPPGVGKTSLARSIAKALGRKYVRISLGGVRDDAEIRGHRRTYIGAMPGRIVDGIKRAGQNNPVFVLDEIDKLNRGWGGDPASALLEVLDPEQNANFLDHYLDVPFDLSSVFFVATANTVESIPAPLLDRMEVIELSGYTTNEKLHIAQRHLVPKILQEHGLDTDQVKFSEELLLKLISSYTREAGVRELQRQISSLARTAAERYITDSAPVHLDVKDLDEALGPDRYILETKEREPGIGVVTGLAWTPMGGDILFIESRLMPGKGQLILTGQMGDVMKESAQIAWSHIRSRFSDFSGDMKLDQMDVHMHIPAGAIPKDGPSAGVALMTSLASLVMKTAVAPDIAMTGEITLRGAVLPVGGIKEKVIAAHRAGIRQVLLPKRNERDLRDVPEDVRSQLEFTFVENIDQVLNTVLGLRMMRPAKASGFDRPSNFA